MSRTPRVAFWLLLALGALLGAGAVATAFALIGASGHPGPRRDGTSVTPTGWNVTPVGRQVKLGERPYGLTRSPDGRTSPTTASMSSR